MKKWISLLIITLLLTAAASAEEMPGSMILGGWEPVPAEAQSLPEDAQTAFDRAMECAKKIGYRELSYPIAGRIEHIKL